MLLFRFFLDFHYSFAFLGLFFLQFLLPVLSLSARAFAWIFAYLAKAEHAESIGKTILESTFSGLGLLRAFLQKVAFEDGFSLIFLLEIVAFSGRASYLRRVRFFTDFRWFWHSFWLPNPSGKASRRGPEKALNFDTHFFSIFRDFNFFCPPPEGPKNRLRANSPKGSKISWGGSWALRRHFYRFGLIWTFFCNFCIIFYIFWTKCQTAFVARAA